MRFAQIELNPPSATSGEMSFSTDTVAKKKLEGKWCVITGGGQGVGQAIAETFAAEGASIALVARSKDKLDKVYCSHASKHKKATQRIV